MREKLKLKELINYGVAKGMTSPCMANYLEKNGVLAPLLKVGDNVFAKSNITKEIECFTVDRVIHYGSDKYDFTAVIKDEFENEIEMLIFSYIDLYKTVFLSKEEAEQALKGGVE